MSVKNKISEFFKYDLRLYRVADFCYNMKWFFRNLKNFRKQLWDFRSWDHTHAIDMYISGSKQSVQAFIFTKNVEAMADAIAFDMKRGVTVLPAKGWYSKEDKQVIMVVTRKDDLNVLLRYVKSIDPDAFLSVSNVMGVYGQGFDAIKVKAKK